MQQGFGLEVGEDCDSVHHMRLAVKHMLEAGQPRLCQHTNLRIIAKGAPILSADAESMAKAFKGTFDW